MAGLKKNLISLGFALNFILAQSVLAAGLQNPLGETTTFYALIEKVTKVVSQIGLPIAALAIIYAGFLFVTARGNEKQLEDAKRTLFWSLIGTAILLGARAIAEAIVNFIKS